MEIATLIFVLSFFAIVSVLVVSATRYMCEQKSKVCFKEEVKENSLADWLSDFKIKNSVSELTRTLENNNANVNTLLGKIDHRFKMLTLMQGAETQEKWKLTVPKHSTRIKNRKKRKGKKK